MSKSALACIVALALALIPTVVLAHPGRTDSSGGHYNRRTGEYHYHHGYPEHQHTNGICPYAPVTATPTATPTFAPTATPTATTAQRHRGDSTSSDIATGFIVCGAAVIASFVLGKTKLDG